MSSFIDLSGRRFGRLTVVRLHGKKPNGYHANGTPLHRLTWFCQCDCGATAVVAGRELRRGETKSCGCAKKELIGALNRTHGMTRKREYRSWQAMKERCGNLNNCHFNNYGGRGIQVCERWRNSFENFLADMGKCPPLHSIDRIDVDGDYTPENCRWADAATQTINRRGMGHWWKGAKRTIKEIAAMEDVPRTSLNKQITHFGRCMTSALIYCMTHRKFMGGT